MDIRKREAMNATRTAFGADYEANLRKEAGPNPEKLARRKHQISSLYHQAKMKVSMPSILQSPQCRGTSPNTVHARQIHSSRSAAVSHQSSVSLVAHQQC